MSDAPRRVFISYSQDSDEHGARVLALAQWLREQGIDAWLDQFEDAPPQGWPAWMHEQLRDADVVLVVASQGYHDKFERSVPRGVGKGVKFESHLIVNEFYELEARTNRFVPVAFDRGDVGFLPRPLYGHTYYVLPDGREKLRDWLLGVRPAHRQARPLGSVGGGSGGRSMGAGPSPKSPAGDSDGGSGPAVKTSTTALAGESPALAVWREKLEYLLAQEPLQVDAAAKFTLLKHIEEARAKIRELELESAPGLASANASAESPAGDSDGDSQLAELRRRREEAQITGEPRETLDELDAQINAAKRELRAGQPLAPNEALGHGRYRLVEFVDKGGFAEIWKAYDRTTKQFVALKILHGYWSHDASKIERFESAARKLAALDHPAIVRVIDGPHVEAGRHYFVMPWLAGGDLRRARARLTREQALDVIARALEGLMHAHARGLVHRDVSPHNVLIDEQGQGWLSDFDLVLDDHSSLGTHTHAGMGKFVYAAKELQENAKDADVRADVYGAGMTIVFALLGKDPPAFVAALQPSVIAGLGCEAGLRRVLDGALAYEREDRTSTCAELIVAIRGRGAVGSAPRAPEVIVRAREPEKVNRSARGDVELVWIPGGEFMMGSKEREGYESERPQHRVVLDGFYLARTTVTNASYRLFLAENSGAAKPAYWGDPSYNQPAQPVMGVSWHDAVAFCEWAGLVLPSEAQWEYACRAGTTSRYSSGNDEAALAKVGWYDGNSGNRLHAVAGRPANAWGLHDMHGNVWEWCRDGALGYRQPEPYSTPARPGDGLRREPVTDELRVLRGGSFGNPVGVARSAYRFVILAGSRVHGIGFRPARLISDVRPSP